LTLIDYSGFRVAWHLQTSVQNSQASLTTDLEKRMADLSVRGLTQAYLVYLGLIWAFDRNAMSRVNQGKAVALQLKSSCNRCSTLLLHVLTSCRQNGRRMLVKEIDWLEQSARAEVLD